MSSPQIERKLAAIMFTDIVGYTALSAKDSTKSSELLTTQRDTLKPIVEKHGGSWMKEMGDGLLLTFDSATSAVECSIAIQEATKDLEDLNLRIGIHEDRLKKVCSKCAVFLSTPDHSRGDLSTPVQSHISQKKPCN